MKFFKIALLLVIGWMGQGFAGDPWTAVCGVNLPPTARCDMWAKYSIQAISNAGHIPYQITLLTTCPTEVVFHEGCVYNFHTAACIIKNGKCMVYDRFWFPEGPVTAEEFAATCGGAPYIHKPGSPYAPTCFHDNPSLHMSMCQNIVNFHNPQAACGPFVKPLKPPCSPGLWTRCGETIKNCGPTIRSLCNTGIQIGKGCLRFAGRACGRCLPVIGWGLLAKDCFNAADGFVDMVTDPNVCSPFVSCKRQCYTERVLEAMRREGQLNCRRLEALIKDCKTIPPRNCARPEHFSCIDLKMLEQVLEQLRGERPCGRILPTAFNCTSGKPQIHGRCNALQNACDLINRCDPILDYLERK